VPDREAAAARTPARDPHAVLPRGFALKSVLPGRLRLKRVGPIGPSVDALAERLRGADGIEVRVRAAAASLVIAFDPSSSTAEAALAGAGIVEPSARAPSQESAPAVAGKWTTASALPGRIRLRHAAIGRSPRVVQELDARLTVLLGVEHHSLSPAASSVTVHYDARALPRARLIELLDALVREAAAASRGEPVRPIDTGLFQVTASTATLLLATASLAVPSLTGAALFCASMVAGRIFSSAIHALTVEHRLRVDVLDATVITLALYYRFAFPAAFMVWIVDVSNVLLQASSRTSRRRLLRIFGVPSHVARRIEGDVERELPVAELQRGDVVVVRAGDQVPVDGVVVEGSGLIDQSALTGEFAPSEKAAGDRVLCMTTAIAGTLRVRVARTGADTNAARLVRLLEHSLEHKARVQTMTERFADLMVVPTFVLGGVGYALQGAGAMMAVINADYGTGIRISGPLALLTSVSACARNGILVKKAQALEAMSKVDTVVFDKTGTLTDEVPEVAAVHVFDPASDREQVLRLAAFAEQRSSHPVARAIRRAVPGGPLPPAEGVEYEVGLGIRVPWEGRLLRVGSRRFMQSEGVAVTGAAEEIWNAIHGAGGSSVLVALDAGLVGFLDLRAGARAEAARVVAALRARRRIRRLCLFSGDHEAPTRALARSIGIDEWRADLLPQDKAALIKELQAAGSTVAMVGDGINDTVGLVQADCSISMRGAADAATDAADVILMDGTLARFPLLLRAADNLTRNLRKSFALTILPNSICIGGALLGVFGLGSSLIFNNVFNLLTAFNGLRAQRSLGEGETAEIRAW